MVFQTYSIYHLFLVSFSLVNYIMKYRQGIFLCFVGLFFFSSFLPAILSLFPNCMYGIQFGLCFL